MTHFGRYVGLLLVGLYLFIGGRALSAQTITGYQWGGPGDIPVACDYDGDGKLDLAVWRPSTSTWYILYSTANYAVSAAGIFVIRVAQLGDVPVPGIYFHLGFCQMALYRPSTGNWLIIN